VLAVVPSYNHGRFLRRRLDTVLNQSFRDVHLLVIDDCSTDETSTVLASLTAPNATVRIRKKNSGSPFAAWRDALDFGEFDYIWIAESDDAADQAFLDHAVAKLDERPNASFYYTHSWVVNEDDEICGHSINYLRRQFPDFEWSQSFEMPGEVFNNRFQIFGQAVPNMSSVLMRTAACRSAFQGDFDKFRLAADWAFIGKLAAQGDVLFDARTANFFRVHERTARNQTPLERTCVEYARAISIIGDQPGVDAANTERSLGRCALMLLHERGSLARAAAESMRFGLGYNIGLAGRYAFMIRRPDVRLLLSRRLGAGAHA
jgi:glycosyltransferase involved in cell wall biosynthesis